MLYFKFKRRVEQRSVVCCSKLANAQHILARRKQDVLLGELSGKMAGKVLLQQGQTFAWQPTMQGMYVNVCACVLQAGGMANKALTCRRKLQRGMFCNYVCMCSESRACI